LHKAAGVAAGIGGGISALDDKFIRASAWNGLIGMADDRGSAAIIRGDNSGIIGCGNQASATDCDIGRDAGDDGGCIVINGDGLSKAALVAASVGGGVSTLDNEFVGAGARGGLIAVGDDRSRATTIGRNDCGIVSGRDGAGAFNADIGRDA